MKYMRHQVKKDLGVSLHGSKAEFRVWAPFAKSVALVGSFTPNGPIALKSEQDGYWSTVIENVEAGQTYKYQIETADGRIIQKNDPRARAITSSDKGFSVVVDNEFEWGDSEFTPPPKNQQIIYELHIGTFNRPDPATTGTFETAIEKLDYLRDLGINMIELMPITSMAYSNGWGYAPNYIYSVESMLGGRYGLMCFVKACHERGIGVILDVVYNHFFGDTDLWQFDGWSENGRGGIYFYNDERGDTPWGGRPDYGRPEVKQFFLDNVTMWLSEYRLDGLRIDSTIYMRNTEGRDNDPTHDIPDAWYLLQDIVELGHKIKPHALMIAEDFACTPFITKTRQETGCGFDAQWELGYPHALRDGLGINQAHASSLDAMQYELEHGYNGDTFEKIIFSDSHDTAANGSVRLSEAAAPERPASLDARQITILADAVTLTGPGMPMLLQGAEFMQEGAFNDWQALQWERATKHTGIITAHQHLTTLRLNRYGNTAGLLGQSTAIVHRDDINHVIAFHRWDQGGPGDDVVVIVNFSDHAFHDYTLWLPRGGTWTCRFNSSWRGYSADFHEEAWDTVSTSPDQRACIDIAPYGVYIISQ